MKKILLVAVILIASLWFKVNYEDDSPKINTDHKFRLYRDEYGIPHIIGKSNNDVTYGIGYAGAQDRLWTMYLKKKLVKG